ncbi:hypothetical protein [Stieleria sedimenti]|uniref:hypothetical protein n=1 Tax=Stieleria sedimenti TaxID=2976331 RepID=UPI00217F5FD8|nr:hypothetical protein [Stieleria sedimenti]
MQWLKYWLVSLLGVIAFSGSARSQDGSRLPSPLKAVFVYANGKRAADEFAKVLQSRQIDTQVVRANDLSEELFADKHLIIIGADTLPVWGFKAADDEIRNAKLPVLAMGEGGYKLLSKLDLDLGNLQVSRGETTSVRPVKQAIFWDGFRPPPVDGAHKCFEKSKRISIQFDDATDGIHPIAAEGERDGHYPLMIEEPCFFFWGFGGTLDQMTKTGRELLCWACYYTVAAKRNPDRAFMSLDEVQRRRKADND